MGRRKKNKEKPNWVNRDALDEIEEEQCFFDLCADMDIEPSWFFKNWKQYYVSRASFLKNATEWLSDRCMGIHAPPIKTDKSYGLECYQDRMNASIRDGGTEPTREDYGHYTDEEFYGPGWEREEVAGLWPHERQTSERQWVKGQGYTGGHTGGYYTGNYPNYSQYTGRKLPLEPKIPAPSGVSGADLMVM